ncbi:hypothetical protein OESDEN_16058 [Oesophagostomum dentatum]|uniref:PNPLA domain-containing protein n=1 Tax=Oesophagostomum dentatum TaxID=61180 RepID=A0A0B1SL41_OESDE|nr:hypothetical protein OESDEN_16058 [Oesophagostomum dentatum]
MASCYIPLYSMGYGAQPPIVDGKACIDGGYTNNLPDFEDIRTITVSPFSGHAEISPRDETNFFDWKMTVANQIMNVSGDRNVRKLLICIYQLRFNLLPSFLFRSIFKISCVEHKHYFPPSRTVLQSYFDMGYKDTLKFLIKNDIVERPTGTEV